MFTKDLYDFIFLVTTSLVSFVFCEKVRMSLAVGYLVGGIIIGPLVLGILNQTPFLEALSHLGVLLFLFSVGLEIPFHRIIVLKRYIFLFGGMLTVCITALLWYVMRFFFPSFEAFVLALSLSFSSTGVVIQLLSEKFEMTSYRGRLALSLLLFQDMAAVALFVYLGLRNQGSASLSWSICGMILVASSGFLLAKITDKILAVYRYGEFICAFVIATILSLSLLSEKFNLSTEVGPFVAGIAMAGTPWRHQISLELHAFKKLFLAIFFMTMGLGINAWPSVTVWGYIVVGLISITAIKIGCVMLVGRFMRTTHNGGLAILIGSLSEFLFIIIPLLKIDSTWSNALLITGFLSMVITPLFYSIFRRYDNKTSTMNLGVSEESLIEQYPVIMAGYGHLGQTVAHVLKENFVSVLVVDYNALAIDKAKEDHHATVHGDVRDIEFLKKIKIHEAKIFIVTFSYSTNMLEVVKALRKKFPHLVIFVQVKDYAQGIPFIHIGAEVIMPELVECGIMLSAKVFETMGFSKENAQQMVHFPHKPSFLSKEEK